MKHILILNVDDIPAMAKTQLLILLIKFTVPFQLF